MRNFALYFFVAFLFFSCGDDDNFDAQSNEDSTKTLRSVTLSGGGEQKTVLGAERENPFTVVRMIEAYNSLYGTIPVQISTTDLYVKFIPDELEELKILEETGEEFYDYPLEYEVLEMGDYYQELTEGELPVLYAVVPSDFVFPSVNYEILSELYLDKSDPLLVAESFRLVGLGSEIKGYVRDSLLEVEIEALPSSARLAVPPSEESCPPGCSPILVMDDITVPVSWVWDCDCSPPPPPPTNKCGCDISSNSKRPAGCVQVEDTQLGMQGVRNVKVIMKDTWFTEDETWTDDNGCWRINKNYDSGWYGGDSAWMWVKFKGQKVNIRGLRGARFWEYAFTVKDYAGRLRHNYNNISIEYWNSPDNSSRQRMYWYAATANNALHEYHDYTSEDGILPPADDLDIMVCNWDGSAAAPMLDDMWMDDAITYSTLNQLLTVLGGHSNPVVTIALNTFLWYINTFSPDVAYFYGDDGMRNSDRVKRTFYHEYAHASHFRNVDESWWLDMIIATIANGGWGDENGTDAGRISIAESWAEFIGMTYSHRQYTTTSSANLGSWETQLERTWNHTPNHVPVGLLHDLLDGQGIELQSCNRINGTGCTIINDQVEGFTISQIYSSLTDPVTNVQEFEVELSNNHLGSTTNTLQQFTNLFNQYGQ